jgi:hypothetical protein
MKLIEKSAAAIFKIIKLITFKYTSAVIIYSMLILISITSQKCFKINNFNYFLITGLFASGLVIYIICEKMLKKIAFRLLFMILVVLSYYCLGVYVYQKNPFKYLYPVFLKVASLIYNSQALDFHLLLPFLVFCVPLLSALFMLIDKKGRGEILILLALVFMINLWINGFDTLIEPNIFAFLLLIISYYAITICKKSRIMLSRKRIQFSVNRTRIVSYGLLVSICIVSFSSAFIRGMGKSNLSDIADKFHERFFKTEDGKNNIFNLSYSGYNESKLGGPVKLNKDIALRVHSDKSYYLRGHVKDAYNGSSWKRTTNSIYKKGWGNLFTPGPGYIGFMTGRNKAEILNPSIDTKLKPKQITIYPENLSTSTLFVPYNTYNIKSGRNQIGYTFDYTFILLNKSSSNTYYTVDFYESDTGLENFISSEFILDYNPEGTTAEDMDYYKKNVKDYYGRYLSVPDNFPERIKLLVQEITGDSNNSAEKILKIHKYLRENYKYSLDVSEVPEDTDFLDYFLFSEKKGYCTYFATAAVMFCRLIGIPARYVEGFSMKDIKDPNGLYIVSNDRAHAWCEILVSQEYNLWSILDCVPELEEVPDNTNVPPPANSIMEWYRQNRNISSRPEPVVIETGDNIYHKQQSEARGNVQSVVNIIKNIFYSLPFLVILFTISYILYRIYYYELKKKLMLSDTSMIPLYYYSKSRLTSIGIENSPSNTEYEYTNNIYDEDLKTELTMAINAYHLEYFGNRSVDAFNKERYFKFIEKYIRIRQNLYKYIFNKYFS